MDKNNWDSPAWDANKQVYWYTAYALRHDVFIERPLITLISFPPLLDIALHTKTVIIHKQRISQIEVTTPGASIK